MNISYFEYKKNREDIEKLRKISLSRQYRNILQANTNRFFKSLDSNRKLNLRKNTASHFQPEPMGRSGKSIYLQPRAKDVHIDSKAYLRHKFDETIKPPPDGLFQTSKLDYMKIYKLGNHEIPLMVSAPPIRVKGMPFHPTTKGEVNQSWKTLYGIGGTQTKNPGDVHYNYGVEGGDITAVGPVGLPRAAPDGRMVKPIRPIKPTKPLPKPKSKIQETPSSIPVPVSPKVPETTDLPTDPLTPVPDSGVPETIVKIADVELDTDILKSIADRRTTIAKAGYHLGDLKKVAMELGIKIPKTQYQLAKNILDTLKSNKKIKK